MSAAPAPGQTARLRFVVKKVAIVGTKKFEFRVYDQQRGSFPYRTTELGEVAQDHPSEKDAQIKADRLTEEFGYIKTTGAKKSRATSVGDRGHDEDDD